MSIQDKRLLALKTPLGDDVLLLDAFHGQEEMSRLFTFDLEMFSDDCKIDATKIVGKNVTFRIHLADGSKRFFNGFVSHFSAGDEANETRDYRARVVPWLWFLTKKSDCRIFQKMKVPDIITQVFDKLGFKDYNKDQLKGNYPEREYCVQYRETDFNFVSRLMEEEGIFYWFKHEDGKHTLMLADQPGGYADCKEKKVDFPPTVGTQAVKDHLTAWDHRYEFRTGKWAQTDYNFETPSTSLMSKATTVLPTSDSKKYEYYDYPGVFLKTDRGKTLTDLRMAEEEVEYDAVSASSLCRSFFAGGKFTVGTHRSKSEAGKEFVITKVTHAAREMQAYMSGTQAGGGYNNTFLCIPSNVKFRPARLTLKPVVQGAHTAVVVGPKGEEIHCDKYGRVKVQFHWDREGKKDENSTCFIRTAHNVAGKQWGFMALPRIGQEVIVDFLEGDPDNPLIVGSVYNAEQMPHYGPEKDEHKAKTYIKTNSTKGGDGHNELMFDDLKDKEQVYVHAEKNMDVRVKNDSKERILNNRHQIIGGEKDGSKKGDQRELIYQDKHLNVKRHQEEHIEGNMKLLIGDGEESGGGNLDLVVAKTKAEHVKGASHLKVGGAHNVQTGAYSLTVGGDHLVKISGNYGAEAGQAVYIKAGTTLVLEATAQLSLKVGGSFIDINPGMISIQAPLVNINSGGAAGAGAPVTPAAPTEAQPAKPTKPDEAMNSTTGLKSAPD